MAAFHRVLQVSSTDSYVMFSYLYFLAGRTRKTSPPYSDPLSVGGIRLPKSTDTGAITLHLESALLPRRSTVNWKASRQSISPVWRRNTHPRTTTFMKQMLPMPSGKTTGRRHHFPIREVIGSPSTNLTQTASSTSWMQMSLLSSVILKQRKSSAWSFGTFPTTGKSCSSGLTGLSLKIPRHERVYG